MNLSSFKAVFKIISSPSIIECRPADALQVIDSTKHIGLCPGSGLNPLVALGGGGGDMNTNTLTQSNSEKAQRYMKLFLKQVDVASIRRWGQLLCEFRKDD